MKRPLISISGPSGAGKSTVVGAAADRYPTYIEDTSDNPHLRALIGGTSHFDAAANQRWFLQRVGRCIRDADPAQSLIIDQDPTVIVKVYARMFRDENRMTASDYAQLLAGLELIEQDLLRWQFPRQRIFLDASPNVLRERVLKRSGGQPVPPLAWYSKVTSYVKALRSELQEVITVSTDQLTTQQVIEHVSGILIMQTGTATKVGRK